MLTLDLKTRLKNKTFILSMLGAIVLLIQQLGFKNLIPSNYADVVNTILTILTMLGIVVDTSTSGVSDAIVDNTANTDDTTERLETETVAESTLVEPTIDAVALQQENADLKAKLDQINSTLNPVTTAAQV